ncbi:MAG: hypothetical protein IPG02_15845 [Ignavibacteria bacterium]|nr:hypothetical protein [Ignavibacteria bacterium]
MSIRECGEFFSTEVEERKMIVATQIIKEIRSRLDFLLNVGLDYLSLDRSARTFRRRGAENTACYSDRSQTYWSSIYSDEPSIDFIKEIT